MNEIPESAPQDAKYWYNRWLTACNQLDEEATQRIVLHGKIQELEEELAEIHAPVWTKYELIKPVAEQDAYVLWTNVAEGPCWVGSRAEALKYGVPESRLRRADEKGSSAKEEAGGHSWDIEFLIAEQLGLVYRKDLAEYSRLALSGSDGMHLLVPFDDAPVCKMPVPERFLGITQAVPRSWIEDEEERLDSYREGCCLCWVESSDGQRFAAVADKVSDESVVLRRTRATDEDAEHLSIRKGEGAAPVADPEPKKD